MRTLGRFLLPDALLLAAGIAALQLDQARETALGLAPTVVAVSVVVGALLSVRFHRGRLLLLLLLVGLADRVLATADMLPGEPARAAVSIVAVLSPVVFMGVALLPERGALTGAGLVRILALAAIALVGTVLAFTAGAATFAALATPVMPLQTLDWTTIPQLALVLTVLALLFILLLWLREPSPIARGIFWSLVAVMAALHVHGVGGGGSSLWFAVAGVILALAVVESSYSLAYHDALTGLPGRRALTEALQYVGERYAVAMVDVDHFKQCNDRWGHDVGDQVLKLVASRLEAVGGNGRAFRYGGEEFALLFPNMTAEQAMPFLEKVRVAVEDSSFVIRHRPRPRKKPARRSGAGRTRHDEVAVTVSLGLAEGDKSQPAESVIAAADKALYRAKESGRNQLVQA